MRICSFCSPYRRSLATFGIAQLVFNALDVILQLPVSITTPMDGDKHRYGVAKIGIHDQPGNPWRKLASSAGLIEVVAQLGPEFI